MVDAVIPNFKASRAAVPNTYDETRRPGSGGQRYFSDVRYVSPPNLGDRADTETQDAYDERYDNAFDARVDAQNLLAQEEANRFGIANLANPARGTIPAAKSTATAASTQVPYYTPSSQDASGIANLLSSQTDLVSEASRRLPVGMTPAQRGVTGALQDAPNDMVAQLLNMGIFTPETAAQFYQSRYPGLTAEQVQEAMGQYGYAQGGNVNGYYLGGPTDGMADQIPATIDNNQPAALSDGEFVVPADVVSHLGNGNSEAGAQNLYSMMDRVRTDRTGNPEQGRQIDPNKYLA
jgi:hypothetical protein